MRILDVIDAASRGSYDEFVEWYQGFPNDPETFTSDGYSMLSICVGSTRLSPDRIRITKRLIADGADANLRDRRYKRTPLHEVFFDMYPKSADFLIEMARLLLDAGAEVDPEDKFLETPLGYAIRNTKAETEELKPIYLDLLRAGADPRHVNSFGKTPLDYAAEYDWRNGFIDIVNEFEAGTAK